LGGHTSSGLFAPQSFTGNFGATNYSARATNNNVFGSANGNFSTGSHGTGGGGLFGSASQSNVTSGGLFGNASYGGSHGTGGGGLFGSGPQNNASGGLFGNSRGVAPQTGSFGFSAGSQQAGGGGGLFGSAPQNNASGGLFGSAPQSNVSSGGLFGNAGGSAPQTGSFGVSASPQQTQQTGAPTHKISYMDVVMEQKVAGYWDGANQKLVYMVFRNGVLPQVPQELQGVAEDLALKVWMTVLVLRWLEKAWSSERNAWALVHQKGCEWLKGKGINYEEVKNLGN